MRIENYTDYAIAETPHLRVYSLPLPEWTEVERIQLLKAG
jgi:hypothetical protein